MQTSNTQEKAAQLLNDFQEISFLKIALILGVSFFVIWIIRRMLPYLANRGPSQLRLYILGAVPVLRLTIILAAILWIIPLVFNITVQNFLVIAGAASVAIGFAFKDYVSSLIAGVVAIFERPYGPGDWVEIEGDYGEVVTVGIRAIRLRTAEDNVITVPHDRIWSNNISNANTGAQTLMCIAHFYLEPDHDAVEMRKVLTDVGLTSAYLNYKKPCFVVVEQMAFGTHYQLKAYPFDLRDQFMFISDMTERGKMALARIGGRELSMAFNTVPEKGKAVRKNNGAKGN